MQIKRGFTLIELLIVIVLFSAGAVVLLQIFSIGLFGGLENENTLIATALAQDKLESIRNIPYNSIADEEKAPVTDYQFFQREVKVTTPQTNLKQVAVNIYWTERTGEMKISFVTYASNI
ncbi:MAG: type II secretion system protein [Candidatus Omnitrophota bacterium]